MDPVSEEEPELKKCKREESRKQVWLITYTMTSPYITAEILSQNQIICDECHSITWRESKYTLIHLNKTNKIRSTKLQSALESMKQTHSIKQSFIVGYEAISSNDKYVTAIEHHPGFRRIVEVLNKNPSQLESWTMCGHVTTNKKSILWKYIETTDPKAKTHGQLVAQINAWAPIVQKTESVQSENESLKLVLDITGEELKKALERNDMLRQELKESRSDYAALLQRVESLDKTQLKHHVNFH